jgi:arylformamidase
VLRPRTNFGKWALVSGIDYEAEYNNRARVPENPALMAGWVSDAAAYREHRAPRRITYGRGPRHVIDVFAGDGQDQDQDKIEPPLVVFIHGGYWQALDGSSFSHMARGLNVHGISVAVPTYDLCPHVSIAEIIAEMQQATRELAKLSDRLVISGHSAGGHLAACMLATDWKACDARLPPRLVSAAYAISGLFELEPLVPTSINKALRLDPAAARASSPRFWKPPSHGSLDAVVGETESAEYHRQSRSIVEVWGNAGMATRYGTVPAANHFTAIAPMADPASPMTLRLKELAGE